jgi:hypothetical protein
LQVHELVGIVAVSTHTVDFSAAMIFGRHSGLSVPTMRRLFKFSTSYGALLLQIRVGTPLLPHPKWQVPR